MNLTVYWYAHGARYYDPQLALWHSSDPLSELYSSSSTYGYVINNPINFVDPNGMTYNKPSDWEREQRDGEGSYYNWELANKMAGMTGSQFGRSFNHGDSGGNGNGTGTPVDVHFDWRTGKIYNVYEDASGRRYYTVETGSYNYTIGDRAYTQFTSNRVYFSSDPANQFDSEPGEFQNNNEKTSIVVLPTGDIALFGDGINFILVTAAQISEIIPNWLSIAGKTANSVAMAGDALNAIYQGKLGLDGKISPNLASYRVSFSVGSIAATLMVQVTYGNFPAAATGLLIGIAGVTSEETYNAIRKAINDTRRDLDNHLSIPGGWESGWSGLPPWEF